MVPKRVEGLKVPSDKECACGDTIRFGSLLVLLVGNMRAHGRHLFRVAAHIGEVIRDRLSRLHDDRYSEGHQFWDCPRSGPCSDLQVVLDSAASCCLEIGSNV